MHRVHADTPDAALLQPAAIIFNTHHQVITDAAQPDLHLCGAGVAGDVVQRFLHQPVEMGAGVGCQLGQVRCQQQAAVDAVLPLPLFGQLGQRLFQPQALQHHRVQVTHQGAKALLQAIAAGEQLLTQLLDLLG